MWKWRPREVTSFAHIHTANKGSMAGVVLTPPSSQLRGAGSAVGGSPERCPVGQCCKGCLCTQRLGENAQLGDAGKERRGACLPWPSIHPCLLGLGCGPAPAQALEIQQCRPPCPRGACAQRPTLGWEQLNYSSNQTPKLPGLSPQTTFY